MIRWHAIYDDGKRDEYAIAGEVHGVDAYTVAKVGKPARYAAWNAGAMLGIFDASAIAKAACQQHALKAEPLSHRHDPDTSRQAAARTVASGQRDDHITRIVAAVRAHPGCTSAELAQLTGLERHEAARRTADAEHQGRIRKGPARKCSVSGRAAVVWRLPMTQREQACLLGDVA